MAQNFVRVVFRIQTTDFSDILNDQRALSLKQSPNSEYFEKPLISKNRTFYPRLSPEPQIEPRTFSFSEFTLPIFLKFFMTVTHYKETKVSTKNNQKISYLLIFNPAYYVYLLYMSIYKSHTLLLTFCKEKKHFLFYIFIFLIGIILCKAEQPLQGIKSLERKNGKMIRKKPSIKCVC